MNEPGLFALPFPDLWVLAYEDEDPLALAVLERRVALMRAHDPPCRIMTGATSGRIKKDSTR